jgi:hypothetical protein
MKIEINGFYVMYSAIESVIRHQENIFLLRTVSGKEYAKKLESKDAVDRLISVLIENMAECESITAQLS